jgi:peptidoglycan/LPS O-acetylase OafA/YrhL
MIDARGPRFALALRVRGAQIPGMKPTVRSQALDGARGAAFLLVLCAHVAPQQMMLLGICGVAFFFTLSGYLITRQIMREADITRYYARRLKRIMPLAYFYLLVNGLIAIAAGHSMSGYGWHFAFASDWLLSAQAPTFSGGVVSHLWTIAVEVQFYMVWPVVLLAAGKRRVPLLVGLCFVALAWRAGVPDAHVANITFPARMDAFAIGGLVALAVHNRWRLPAALFGATLLALSLAFSAGVNFAEIEQYAHSAALLFTAMPIVFGVAISAIVQYQPVVLQSAPLVWCGERAYSLYIWHVPVLLAAGKLPVSPPLQFLAALPAIFVVAWASHRWCEIGANDWLTRHAVINPSATRAA